jgi:hypothetical protein
MKNLLMFLVVTLLFSCEGNLKKTSKNVTSKEIKKEVKIKKPVDKEPENTLKTEVTLVMQEYGYTGLGTYISPSGGKYVGEWKNGKYDGKGTYTFPDERYYVGDWKNGKMDGQGKLTLNQFDYHEGGFKDGNYHGKGVHSQMSEGGPIISKGTWLGGIWTIRE